MSAPTARDSLAAALGVDVRRLDFLGDLDEAHVAQFESVFRDALVRDAATLEQGIEDSLRFVPRLMRGTARKMIFGGEG